MATLVLEHLTKDFGKVRAVNDLSLRVEDREFLVLLGPSGAGKTTTLKLISGVEQITSGYIFIGDKVVNAIEPQHRNVAMAFETYALYPHYTVYDNLAFPLRAPGRKLPPAQVDQRVKEIAELLNIHMLLDRQPGMLSGGQRQRVSLGRAMVRNPDILLLDEPISHLDAKLRHRMPTEFKALESKIQTTTVYVTHDYLEALSLGDRVAVMNQGRLHQVGTPDEVFSHPIDIFVSTMLGQPKINLVECDVKTNGDNLYLVSLDGSISLLAPPKVRDQILQANLARVVAGIRPLYLHPSNGHLAGVNILDATVYVYERLGTKGILTVMVGPHQLNIITPIEMQFGIDEKLGIAVEAENILVFDPTTEKNIMLS
jgi:multiple sugar transport system ATP-binding protein